MPLSRFELKALLRENGLRLSKRRGQNYLIDVRQAQNLVRLCRLQPQAVVLEIGAGLGALTELLAEQAQRVIAVEIDRGICPLLRERMRPWPNVAVVEDDILNVLPAIQEEVIVIGAIPYSMTSDILLALCRHKAVIREAWLLMQHEVARRLEASAGSADYGRLSILVQYFWEVGIAGSVSAEAFFPEPQVDSTFVRLRPVAAPEGLVSEALFFKVVTAAFSCRRKRLVHGLSNKQHGMIDKAAAESMLAQLGWDPGLRAEHLDQSQYVALTNMIQQTAGTQR